MENLVKSMDECGVVCRTCLKAVKDENFSFIEEDYEEEKNGNLWEMLQFSVPELDLYVSAKPAICSTCIKTLVTIYNFKVKCLNGENMIKGYITRNNLIDYNYVNLNCVIQEETKIKNQMDGKSVKNQIEDKIKQYMEEDMREDSNKMDTSGQADEPPELTKEEDSLQETKDIPDESEDKQDQEMPNLEEESQDSVPLSEVLEKLCQEPDKVSEVAPVKDQKKDAKESQENTKEVKTTQDNNIVVGPQQFKIIPLNINKDLMSPTQPKDGINTTSQPLIINQGGMQQAVILPQGLIGTNGKPMLIRIDMSKFLAQQNANAKQNVAVTAENPVVVKKEVVTGEKSSENSSNDTLQKKPITDKKNMMSSDESDESDDAFDEAPPVKIKEEPSVTITADDIIDNTLKTTGKDLNRGEKTTTQSKPKITLVRAESLLKKSTTEKTTVDLPQLILKKPSELYSVMSSGATSSTTPKFIIQQNSMAGGTQPKFILQPTCSTASGQPQIILNNSITTTTGNQPKIIIQQNKDGTFKTIQPQLIPVSGASSAGQKIIVKPATATTYPTAMPNVIKIIPATETPKETTSSSNSESSNAVSLENLFKIVTTPQISNEKSAHAQLASSRAAKSGGIDDYICTHCPFSTTKVDLLGKHMSTVHPQPGFKVPKGPTVVENYACFLCPFSASTMELLRGHHMNFHADQLGDEQMRNFLSKKKKDRTPASLSKEQTERELQILEKVMKRPEYACNVCIYTTKDKSNFRKHLFTHGTKPMNCPHCQYNCVSPYQMRRHYRLKHPKSEFNLPKGKPYPPVPSGCIKKEIDDDEDYKITLETLKSGKMEIDLEGTVL